MNEIYYRTHGPLLSTKPDTDLYVKRVADDQAYVCMQRMEYITLIEPPQQGKTSLIYRLINLFTPQDYTFAWIDLSTMDKSNEAAWYKSIYTWILRNLRQTSFLVNKNDSTLPANGYTWLTFLTDIAELAEKRNVRVVFIFDEVGATPPAWSTDFFSAIRSIYNQRQSLPCLHHLNIIVAGAFNPRALIKDPNVSNFNIAQRVTLPDFTKEEARMLVSRLGLSAKKTALIVDRIFYWTSGQPNLTQLLCMESAKQIESKRSLAISEAVGHAVQQFFRTDRQHLAHMREALKRESTFTQEYVQRIWRRSHPIPAFVPAENHIQAQLALIGIVKEDLNGNCIIRNRIYEHALEGLWPNSNPVETSVNFTIPKPTRTIEIFFYYAHEDEALLKKLKKHMSILKRQGVVTDWYDREINAGQEWESEIMAHLKGAHIVLLLISAAFMASDYCYSVEMKRAIERHALGKSRVIPVILRPVTWQDDSLSKLSVLPVDGRPVTSWPDRDEAFSHIVAGIQTVIEELIRIA